MRQGYVSLKKLEFKKICGNNLETLFKKLDFCYLFSNQLRNVDF